MNQLDFQMDNIAELLKAIENSVDGKEFPIDVECIDWKNYLELSMFGIRKYLFKEDMESLPQAKNKLKM